MAEHLEALFREWWQRLPKADRERVVAYVRKNLVDQRLLTLLIEEDVPLPLVLAEPNLDGRGEILDPAPVADLVRHQPQYAASAGAATLRGMVGARF